jgi:hypothetical protein
VESRQPIARLTPSNEPASGLPTQAVVGVPPAAPAPGLLEAADPVALEARAVVAEARVRSEGVAGIAGRGLAPQAAAVPRAWGVEVEVFEAEGDVGADERALAENVIGDQTL